MVELRVSGKVDGGMSFRALDDVVSQLKCERNVKD